MNKIIFALLCSFILGCSTNKSVKEIPPAVDEITIVDEHNSRNSLDWDGIYRGIFPCADCESITIELKLNKDYTYRKKAKYLGKGNEINIEEGKFSWNEAGSNILIDEEISQQYKVGENILIKLDQDGEPIDGELAANYKLQKVQNNIFDRKWSLVELNNTEVNSKKPFILFDGDAKRIVGNGGCNRFSGAYKTLTADSISFGPIASTKMACPGNSRENEFYNLLDNTVSYSVKGDSLILRADENLSGTLVNKFFE